MATPSNNADSSPYTTSPPNVGTDTNVNMSAEAQRVRNIVTSFAESAKAYGIISESDATSMTAGVDDIRTRESLRIWQRFADVGIPSQERTYRDLRSSFDNQMRNASHVLSAASLTDWENRFRQASYQERKYFIDHQLPSFVQEWKSVAEKRTNLESAAKKGLTKDIIPDLDAFLNRYSFRQLRFREQKDLLGRVEAALAVHGNENMTKLYATAMAKLEKAVTDGAMSRSKIGVWLDRIFNHGHDRKKIETFVKDSLNDLIVSWEKVAYRFYNVQKKIHESDNMAVKSHAVDSETFLRMHYAQRVSFVKEAERSLEVSKNVAKENPRLLRIRHALDMQDWESADDEIRLAQREDLTPEDMSRLHSMRQYLTHHRTDGKVTGRKEVSNHEQVKEAQAKLDGLLGSNAMDEPIRTLTLMLVPSGSKSVANLKWTISNYAWCEKNGYLDEEKAQVLFKKHKGEALAKVKKGSDPGLIDPIIYGDEKLIRKDKDQRESEVRATLQYADITNGQVIAKLAEWYKNRDPDVLYWTTFIACKGDQTLGSDWHQKHKALLKEICSALRVLENSGQTYSGPGQQAFSTN